MVGWWGVGGGQLGAGPAGSDRQSPLGHEKGWSRLSVLLAAPQNAALELFHTDDRHRTPFEALSFRLVAVVFCLSIYEQNENHIHLAHIQ